MTLKNLHDQNVAKFIAMANKIASNGEYDVLRLSNSKYFVEIEKVKDGRDWDMNINLYQGNPSDLFATSFYIDGTVIEKSEFSRMELESCFDELMNYSLCNYIGSTDERRNDASLAAKENEREIAEDKAFKELFGFSPSEMINEEALDKAIEDGSLASLINDASSQKTDVVSNDTKSHEKEL